MSFKSHFSRFLGAEPDRLHFAAHSHHYWPDVTYDAQKQAWLDAAARVDGKWEHILGPTLRTAQGHIARLLNLSDPKSVAFSPNTHEMVVRLLSCFEHAAPVRVLTTDSEFHSFERQSRRLEEVGILKVERVRLEPFSTFADRFLARAARGAHDLVFVSQVFYNSGFVFDRVPDLAEAVPSSAAFIVVDGYHAFMALPIDLSEVEERVFFLAGGYKYAMSGEGVCFMHCPPGWGPRPLDTGWYAGFVELEDGMKDDEVPYSRDGYRFMGATFDPSGLYRFNAVMDLWARLGVSVDDVHALVRSLQERFLARLEELNLPGLDPERLIPERSTPDRGHFLTFRTEEAGEISKRLARALIQTDYRGDRLRFGFGLYHDPEDVETLCSRLAEIFSQR